MFVALGSEGFWANIESNELVEIVNDYNTWDLGNAIDIIHSKLQDNYTDGSVKDDVSLIISYL